MVDFHKDKSLSLTTMGENSWPSTFCFLKGTVTTTMWAHAMYGEQCSLSDSRNPVYVYKEGRREETPRTKPYLPLKLPADTYLFSPGPIGN